MSELPFALATPDEVCAELGHRLRLRRLGLDVTQQQLARRAGIAVNAVKKLEASGQVTLSTLVRVAIALGVADELEHVFALRPQSSLADMERAEAARRTRARGRGA